MFLSTSHESNRMVEIVLIRHGPTEWNEQKRLQGQSDIPLSAKGRERVKSWKIPKEFLKFDWVVSPLSRAKETALLLGVSPSIEPAIIEMDWGNWEGRTGEELREIYGKSFGHRKKLGIDLQPEGGESPRKVRERVEEWVLKIASTKKSTGAVAHQGIIRAMISLATGWNMINPSPERINWDSVHLFTIKKNGLVKIGQLNISLNNEKPSNSF